jgi:hypothetical protein
MGGGKCVVFGLHKRWVGKKVYGDGWKGKWVMEITRFDETWWTR